MKPAYMVIAADVLNPRAIDAYRAGTIPLLARYNGEFIVATGDIDVVDGKWSRQRVALVKFPSLKHARAFWAAPEYTPLRLLINDATVQDCILVEGLQDEEPGSAKDEGAPHYMLGCNDAYSGDWLEEYREKVPPIAAKYGMEALVASDQGEVLVGEWPRAQTVLLKFPSKEACEGFWTDADYKPLKELREANADGDHIAFPHEFD